MSWKEVKAYLKGLFFEPGKELVEVGGSFPPFFKGVYSFLSSSANLVKMCFVLSIVFLFLNQTFWFTLFLFLTVGFYLVGYWIGGEWRQNLRCQPCWEQAKREQKYVFDADWVLEERRKNPEKSRPQIIYERIHNERCLKNIKEKNG